MRRLLLLVVPVAAAALLSGCSGADAVKAQSLLQQARQAQRSVSSERFVMKLGLDLEGKSAEVDMQGGGYLEGDRAGDFYLALTGSIPDSAQPLDVTVVKQGQQVTMRENGRTETLSLPQAQQQLGTSLGDLTKLTDLAQYVKDVSVSEEDFQGRPADKVVGILDTQALFGNAGVPSSLFSSLGIHTGDVRAVLYIPRDTHLVEAMFADLTLSARGHDLHMSVSMAVSGVNQPVDFPTL